MKIIILAAGQGSRLGNPSLPKPLTRLLNGQSILDMQVAFLNKVAPWSEITLVVGFQHEKIQQAFPHLHLVYNPNYAQENTSKSLWLALKEVKEDVLWLNGDVVFHPSVLEGLTFKKTSFMVVTEGPTGDEEIKYRTNTLGAIVEVSKEVENGEGEAVGINFFKKKDLPVLMAALEQCQPNDYFEKGIQTAILKGIRVTKHVIPLDACSEVDFPEDLCHANQLIQQWGLQGPHLKD